MTSLLITTTWQAWGLPQAPPTYEESFGHAMLPGYEEENNANALYEKPKLSDDEDEDDYETMSYRSGATSRSRSRARGGNNHNTYDNVAFVNDDGNGMPVADS